VICSHKVTVVLGAASVIGLIVGSSAMRWSLRGQLLSNIPSSIVESLFMMILITSHNIADARCTYTIPPRSRWTGSLHHPCRISFGNPTDLSKEYGFRRLCYDSHPGCSVCRNQFDRTHGWDQFQLASLDEGCFERNCL